MSNLLDTLGKKDSKTSAEGAAHAAPQSTPADNKSAAPVDSPKPAPAATGQTQSAGGKESDSQNASGKGEPAGTVNDPNSWTMDTAFKEIKRLREENKNTREKYQDSVEKLKVEMEARISTREKELDEFRNAQKELQDLKDKEADKKRDLAEKVAHREAQVAELKVKTEILERQYQDKLHNLQTTVEQFRVKEEAQRATQQKRLDEELATIPEKYKDVAGLIVKGAGDPTDALLAISEAKIKGVFEDKTIVVNHSVPGAHDGARSSKDRLEAADKEMRQKMTPQQKIGQALKDMKNQPNTAFRTSK